MEYFNEKSKSVLQRKIKEGKNFFQIFQASRTTGNILTDGGYKKIQAALLQDETLCRKIFPTTESFEKECDKLADGFVLNFVNFYDK